MRYEKAKEKFDQILAYRDSTILSQESSYRLGLKEQEAGNWQAAAVYFERRRTFRAAP